MDGHLGHRCTVCILWVVAVKIARALQAKSGDEEKVGEEGEYEGDGRRDWQLMDWRCESGKGKGGCKGHDGDDLLCGDWMLDLKFWDGCIDL